MRGSFKKDSKFTTRYSNINLLWAALFIEELVRNGITDFCIAPGSRSTPLTLAAANHKKAACHMHFDERGLGFLALGISLATHKPVVIITTSGTAAANLYSAVIEAKQSEVPLIILSADRPPQLINCGANQAINQHGLFSDYPSFFAQIPSPTEQIKPNYLLTTLDQGLAKQKEHPAPIHFNLAFCEPLYPDNKITDYRAYLSPLSQWLNTERPFSSYITGQSRKADFESSLADKKVLIVAGRLKDKTQALQITQFAQDFNYPLFTDIQSSLSGSKNNLCYYDLLLSDSSFQKELQQADIILQFGDQLISKRLSQFIDQFAGQYWLVQEGNRRIDPSHRLNKRFTVNAGEWLQVQRKPLSSIDKNWLIRLEEYNQQLSEQIITPFFDKNSLSEISVVYRLDKLLPADKPFFIGNSMPVRIADMFMKKNQSLVFTNRGASGIDGLTATTAGINIGSSEVTTLLIGDTSFLYDLNSLALLKQLNSPVIIIVINNDGGAIFNLLAVPEAQKQSYYQLPHGLNFADSCKQFSIDYYRPAQLDEFEEYYQKALENSVSLIEICVENNQTNSQLALLKEQIKNATF
ncbi:2-succinyl-5-enolpyruvyl-6-hydroxy-3-cyclohexene-1-carboxylic-acid synthase [Psychromonas ossibalaenae]|uniref:2-succinyl-5-enolpyruvyl-6-hydroxy-3- cyclohexene-1-carboxylic-acid synthase n=1 Tax=Psychromonas ossibalaenae TaxID=444922 RepID=UPI00036EC719|nr:2-succinyl-5-enolpyruvyl-6-hydroxy-3-cyclohexene-1-carboxylic-acid synthase [Psychromonas ossibalaenae]